MQKLFAVELVFVFVLFAISGESLKCYVCRSDSDEGCDGSSNMNESLSKVCPANANASGVYCRKIHQKLRFKNEDSWTSIRECAYEMGKRNCYTFKWVDLAYQEICECQKDNCNRGSNRSPNILTITFALSMWMFSYLKTDHT